VVNVWGQACIRAFFARKRMNAGLTLALHTVARRIAASLQ
jgi:hypothetical protein